MAVSVSDFGNYNGHPVRLFTLRSAAGNEARISTLGATLTRWIAPGRTGHYASIVLGYDSPEPYLSDTLPYFNSIVGRYANRIANGQFELDGKRHQVSQNEGINHLHGGVRGFDKRVWEAEQDGDGVLLRYLSQDGEEGYPGNLDCSVRYTLEEENTLVVSCEAKTDAPTIVNMTIHGWYNLSGPPGSAMLDHELRIAAGKYTPVGAGLIPTGELLSVEGTPFDFRKPRTLGDAVSRMEGGGYDHNFVLDTNGLEAAALSLYHPVSGRLLEIFTEEPGMQIYTAQGFDGSLKTEEGRPIPKYGAIVLEPQHFPDSPNQSQFPSTVLKPGETYRTTSRYKCSVQG
jgi:aldose 1-epimerase